MRTRGAGGVAELEKLLSNAVVQLHEFCKKSVTFSGTVSLEGTLTLRTDVAATVLIKTHTQDGLKVVTEQDAIGEEATEVRRKEKSIKQEPQTEKRKPESPAPRLTRNKAKKGHDNIKVPEENLEASTSFEEGPPAKRKKKMGPAGDGDDDNVEKNSNAKELLSEESEKSQTAVADGAQAESGITPTKTTPENSQEKTPAKSSEKTPEKSQALADDSPGAPETPIATSETTKSTEGDSLVQDKNTSNSGAEGDSAVEDADKSDDVSTTDSKGKIGAVEGEQTVDDEGDSDEGGEPYASESEELLNVKMEEFLEPKDKVGKFLIVGVDSSAEQSKKLKMITCELCYEEVLGHEAFQTHIDSVHGVFVPDEEGVLEKRYGCSHCKKTYKHFIDLKYHYFSHTGKMPHKCKHCGKGFIKSSILKQHIVQKHTPGRKCKKCRLIFKDEEKYNKHMAAVHTELDLYCKLCKKTFTTKLQMRNHNATTHGKKQECPHCGEMVAKRYMNNHLKTHLGIKPFKCEHCGKRFISAITLKNHSHFHTTERRYKCTYCGLEFYLASRANEHARIHTGERPYLCDICGESFAWNGSLKRHKLGHTGEKPYNCKACGKTFSAQAKCLKHLRRHHPNVAPFDCVICNTGFFTKDELDEHSVIHVNQPLEINNHSVIIHEEAPLQVAIESIPVHTVLATVDAAELAQGIEITT